VVFLGIIDAAILISMYLPMFDLVNVWVREAKEEYSAKTR